jgi:hypothetical protein
MTHARRELVSLDDTPYYHCVSRCVRRAFLCGEDAYSQRSYEHRKAWVTERLQTLSEVFAVDICAYAVMSNHYHLVVHIDKARADGWSDGEVIARWRKLFQGPPVIARHLAGEALTAADRRQISALVALWRSRLRDISWYMRCLNEHIARRANGEDGCTGRFWEGRYKCQALLDEAALLTAMAYVDLNPVRAKMATDLIGSDHTSVQQRLFELAEGPVDDTERLALMRFAGTLRADSSAAIPFNLQDYLDLVDGTRRSVREDKRGALDQASPRLLETLGLEPGEWLPSVTELQARFELVIGAPERLRRMAEARGRCFYRGYGAALRLYRRAVAA